MYFNTKNEIVQFISVSSNEKFKNVQDLPYRKDGGHCYSPVHICSTLSRFVSRLLLTHSIRSWRLRLSVVWPVEKTFTAIIICRNFTILCTNVTLSVEKCTQRWLVPSILTIAREGLLIILCNLCMSMLIYIIGGKTRFLKKNCI